MNSMNRDEPAPTVAAVNTVQLEDNGWVTARAGDAGFRTAIVVRGFELVADEPTAVGGSDGGPTPYELLLGALAACASMTLIMYAKRKSWPLKDVVIRLRDAPSHAVDCANCEIEAVGIRRIERQIELHGPLADDQRERLLRIADRCPIKQTLERGLVIETVS